MAYNPIEYLKQGNIDFVDKLTTYDRENLVVNISNMIFILGYFIFYPFYHEGQTLGKKVLRIKIEKEKQVNIFNCYMKHYLVL